MDRTVRRVLIENNIRGDQVFITDAKKTHHLLNVLRIRKGDDIRIFNEHDGEWLATIVNIKGKHIEAKIQQKLREPEAGSGIRIAFSPIKQDRLKFLIEKSTEIGVDSFIPVITNRSVIRDVNIKKLESYIVGAVEQSERITVPTITKPYDLKDFLKDHNKDTIVFCNESEQNKSISRLDSDKNYIILIGSEGGFTEQENNLFAVYPNVISVKLTKNILRAETAAIVALSNFMI
jgi:16S rRNA (uracil1498-N3)-methyltransferase